MNREQNIGSFIRIIALVIITGFNGLLPAAVKSHFTKPDYIPNLAYCKAIFSDNEFAFTIPSRILVSHSGFELYSLIKKKADDRFLFVDPYQGLATKITLAFFTYSKAVVIGFTKKDIIFPFHYFW